RSEWCPPRRPTLLNAVRGWSGSWDTRAPQRGDGVVSTRAGRTPSPTTRAADYSGILARAARSGATARPTVGTCTRGELGREPARLGLGCNSHERTLEFPLQSSGSRAAMPTTLGKGRKCVPQRLAPALACPRRQSC